LKDQPPDTAAPMPRDPILRTEKICKRFGGAVALEAVTLSVAVGSIAGLIGPNGAGKTTLFDILAGDSRASSGEVFLRGRALGSAPVHTRLAAGLGRTFQIPRPFAGLTVVENVMLGSQQHAGERLWPNWLAPRRVARLEARLLARAMELLDFVMLTSLAHEPARVLSGGQRKLLELARVLMAEPALVLLDEPAAGVNPALLDIIIERIAALNRQGISFLIVEHDMELVARLCSEVFVIASGRLLCQGTAQAVLEDRRVIDAYLGGVAA
jgi:branched-chain amino acid transport system ATP-binding protein